MAFNQAAVNSLFSAVESQLMQLGVFDSVNAHEPRSAPQKGISASVWADQILPAPAASGVNVVSGVVVLNIRVYSSALAQPLDAIDPNMLTAVSTVMNAFAGSFTFAGSVRNIDLLGAHGRALSAQAGYVEIDRKWLRVMTITVPVIINDMFTEVP